MIISYLNNKTKKYNKTFNRLYNDYISINKKKENMKINYLRNESKLYPFTPRIDNKNFVTFSPSTIKKNSDPGFLYYSERIPLNQKFKNFFNKNNKNGRNNFLDNEYFNMSDKNRYYKNFSENDKSKDMQYKFFNNKMNPINLKQSSYRYPNKRNIKSSRINDNINNQLLEYIKGNNKNSNYLNNKRNSNFNLIKNKKSSMTMNKERKIENLFNKSNKRDYGIKSNGDLLSFIYKGKSNSPISFTNKFSKNKIQNRNKGNSINKISDINNKEKITNSNKSLNPSSLGIEQTRTFYTNNNIRSNNALMSNNINSTSMPNTHYLLGLKISSGINECFYDINKENKNNKNELSMQSINDSKMMELASKYISEEENSSENYYMNNIIHNKKKFRNKKK